VMRDRVNVHFVSLAPSMSDCWSSLVHDVRLSAARCGDSTSGRGPNAHVTGAPRSETCHAGDAWNL